MMNLSAKRRFKDAVYGELSRIGKALANEHRLELLDVLAQRPRTVDDLAKETGMSVANTSQHLQVLHRSRLIDRHKEGTYVYYRLASERVFHLWQELRQVGERQLAEVRHIIRAYRDDPATLEPVGLHELRERVQRGDVVLLDVRPPDEYRTGHIPGARSVPLQELEARVDELPADADVVAYCRGPYCVMADEAVEHLRERGMNARRFELGFPDWKAADLPVETVSS